MKIKRDKVMEQYRRNFYNIYHTNVAPILQSYEQERIKNLVGVIVIGVITAVLTLSVFVYAVNQKNDEFAMFFTVPVVCIGALGCWIISTIRTNFFRKLKEACMGHIVQVFGNLSWFSHIDMIGDDEVRNSELFDSYNYRSCDDSFSGEYKGVNFKICETHMRHEEGYGKNRREFQVFKGALVKFDFNKSINSKTVIMTKADKSKFGNPMFNLGLIALFVMLFLELLRSGLTSSTAFLIGIVGVYTLAFAWKGKNGNAIKLQELKLEAPEFNKHYRAYSTDQVEGRYLITPAFMERFKHIQTAFGAKGAKCAFYDSHILFALSTNKNLFEIGGLFHSLNDPKQMEEFFNELTSIMRLIDRFKLTEHTGL